LVDALSQAAPAGKYAGLLWANHVLFRHAPFFPTDSVAKENIKGTLMIDTLEFTMMETYKREIVSKDRGVVLTIADVSTHTLFDPLTKWIYKNYLNPAQRPKLRRK
jgi:hypothetical protein